VIYLLVQFSEWEKMTVTGTNYFTIKGGQVYKNWVLG